jgi:hypothetical protein
MNFENKGLQFVRRLWEEKSIPVSSLIPKNNLSTKKIKEEFGQLAEGEMGIYAFWWKGMRSEFNSLPKFKATAPGGEEIILQWSFADFPKECYNIGEQVGKFPLYIGKTTVFVKRLGQHLKLGTYKWTQIPYWKDGMDAPSPQRLSKPTSTCQLRTGLEYLFSCQDYNAYRSLLKKVEVTYIPIKTQGNDVRVDVSARFYLEDLAIGYYRPWFNVDSER